MLALGGALEPEWLLDAYGHGIFPWPYGDDSNPIAWWSPDPRGVLELADLRLGVDQDVDRLDRRVGAVDQLVAALRRDLPTARVEVDLE